MISVTDFIPRVSRGNSNIKISYLGLQKYSAFNRYNIDYKNCSALCRKSKGLMKSNFANQIFILYNIHFTLRIIPIAFSPLGNHMFFTSRLISLLNGRHSFRLW